MKGGRNLVRNGIIGAAIFDKRFHYRREGYQCVRCCTYDRDCFFMKQLSPGRRPICTNCKRLKKGCHEPSTQRVSASPEPGRAKDRQHNDQTHGFARLKSKIGTSLGKRKARRLERTTMDHVSSSSCHDSDSDSQYVLTPPPASTPSRIDFKNLAPRTAASIAESIVVRHIPIPSAFRLSSAASNSFTPARTNPHEIRTGLNNNPIQSCIQPSSSFTPAHTNPREIRPKPSNPIPSSIHHSSSSTSFVAARTNPHHKTLHRPNNPFPPPNQPSSSSTSLPLAPANPANSPYETQPETSICTAVRQMEHVNATMVALYEALEGEIREAEEADRTRRARIYRIESAMKMVNQDVRAAANVLQANVPISVEDRARLDPELDRYRKMLATLHDRRVHRDRAAQERQRREQEHRDLLDDELLGRLGKR